MAVALLALMVALGGSSYAALRIGSGQVVDNSIRSKDIRNNDIRGGDIRNGSVWGTDLHDGSVSGKDIRDGTLTGQDIVESSLAAVPSAQNAQTLAGKPASAFLSSDKQVRSGLIKLVHGETKTVASYGPFTWTAACSDVGAGITRLVITVTTTEANSFVGDFGSGGQPVSPGSPATLLDQSQVGSLYTIGFPLSAVAPSGAAPAGLAFAGLGVLGADCVVNGVLWP
jgi:hypothetical protein